MNRKRDLTEEIYNKIPVDQRPASIGHALFYWWRNPRISGMRLTDLGLKIFEQYSEITSHEAFLPVVTDDLKTLLLLDRRLQEPYWITEDRRVRRRIIFFGSKEAMLFRLYGDLTKFLENYIID
jgi:hypothetical protein